MLDAGLRSVHTGDWWYRISYNCGLARLNLMQDSQFLSLYLEGGCSPGSPGKNTYHFWALSLGSTTPCHRHTARMHPLHSFAKNLFFLAKNHHCFYFFHCWPLSGGLTSSLSSWWVWSCWCTGEWLGELGDRYHPTVISVLQEEVKGFTKLTYCL